MKFISFITSTMLIVLISQHSMGLPLTSTIVGETCPEGFEMFNGECKSIHSSTIGVETETITNLPEIITSTLHEEDPVTEVNGQKISKECPPGSKYLKGGKCGPVEPLIITKLKDESATSILPETITNLPEIITSTLHEEDPVTEVNGPKISKECPPGSKYLKGGKCGPVEPLVITKLKDETATSILPEITTNTLPEEDLVTDVSSPKISKHCPPGSKYLKGGKCGPVGPLVITKLKDETATSILPETATVEFEPTVFSHTTEIIHELTTGVNDDERTGGVDNPQGCPKGTEADEQGACQEIQGASTEYMATEPNFPVNQTCPGGYEKFNGKCVYVETKTSSDDLLPKTGDVETFTNELVPISEDGTCPDGTAYIASGFCKKLNRPTPANVPMSSDGRCRANYELVDEICVYKVNKISAELGVLASTIQMPLHHTVDEEHIEVNTENLFQSTATVTDN